MSFGRILSEVADREKRVIVYAPDDSGGELADVLATRNLTVDQRRLPALSSEAFVVVRDDGEFQGALSLEDLLEFLTPPIRRPEELDSLARKHRVVYELLDDTVFVSLDRRQLLATSRELEDRAWRTGRGRLHVGFQRADAFAAQTAVYRELATTDIDIHLYVPGGVSGDPLADTPVTVHTENGDRGRYWFILFDDGERGAQNCALIARETEGGRYRGLWTYDADLVAEAFDAVE
ncbi:DICT sensory domain-containing protein [Haloarcula onubensis]|uniref:Sensor protein n=1 Tax=Haloarcula onubensis TaxID=2950539 RepID=A0ABU2FMP3_9EURY|nr:DICT sensory domain-containing protein [Halomicroarcula sp. S3CR25-11]MDS0282008.1 sensor protein [Halomicroarcula sp. S3CR25-11]